MCRKRHRGDQIIGKAEDCKALRTSAARCERPLPGSVVPTGFELDDVTPSTPRDLGQLSIVRAAESGALAAGSPPIDPEMVRVIEAWPSLSAAIRAGVLAMIDATETTAAE